MGSIVYGPKSPGFWKLLFAKDFVLNATGEVYEYKQNIVERIGRAFRWGVGSFLDFFVSHFKICVTVIVLTLLSFLVVSICFYDVVVFKVLPFMLYVIKPTVLKTACYVVIQTTIFGVALRTIGRLSNKDFMEEYSKGDLRPILTGMKLVKN